MKTGRPTLPENKGKRFPLNMRTTKELREAMEAAAKFSGRSLAQEVEYRLERSLWIDDLNLMFNNEIGEEAGKWFGKNIKQESKNDRKV